MARDAGDKPVDKRLKQPAIERRFGGIGLGQIILTLMEHYPLEEAAGLIGCNPNTLKRWISERGWKFRRAHAMVSSSTGNRVRPKAAAIATVLGKVGYDGKDC